MSYLKDREVWLEKTPTGNPPAGYYWKFIQDGVVVVRDSAGVDKVSVSDEDIINDLTTGGATKVLSAEQGVTLEDTKQATLVSGTNIKTINSESILGAGDLGVGGGKVLQVVFASHSTQVTSSAFTYSDTGLTGSITPTSATSEIYIYITNPINVTVEGDCNIVRGSTNIYTGAWYKAFFGAYIMNTRDLPATTSAVTYKVQHRSGGGGNFTSNYQIAAVRTSTMILIEVEPPVEE